MRNMELNRAQNRDDEKTARICDLQQAVIESETVLANFQAGMERDRRNFAEELRVRQREVNSLKSQLLVSQSALARTEFDLQQKEEPRLQAALKKAADEKNAWQTRLDQGQEEIDRLRADLKRSADREASAQRVIDKEIEGRRNVEEENVRLKSRVAEAQLKSEQVEKRSQIEFLKKSLEKDITLGKERQKVREEEKKLAAEYKAKVEQLLESKSRLNGDEIDTLREQLESQTKMGVEKFKEKEKPDG